MKKIRSSKVFESGGMRYEAIVEQSDEGGGDNGFPTRIMFHSDDNYFEVSTDGGVSTSTFAQIKICGEWETHSLGNVFKWIGEELNSIHVELKGDI